MSGNPLDRTDTLIAHIETVTADAAPSPVQSIPDSVLPSGFDAMLISLNATEFIALPAHDVSDYLTQRLRHPSLGLGYSLAGIGFWLGNTHASSNFATATVLRWLIADVACARFDAADRDRVRAQQVMDDPRLFPALTGTCVLAGAPSEGAEPAAVGSQFIAWWTEAIQHVARQRDHGMYDVLNGLGIPTDTSDAPGNT